MGKLERAKIIVLEGDGKGSSGEDIDVCFNPKEYSLEKSVSWDSEKAFSDAPQPEFTKPSPMTLSVTLQFDTYEERVSVRDKFTKKLEKAAHMRGELGKKPSPEQKKKASPPVIIFQWGRFTFKGVIESLSQKYTMFLSDGTPVRAEVGLKIRNVITDNFDSGQAAADARSDQGQTYTPKQGDRLDLIAADKLGDAGRWTEIAAMNGIDDPAAPLPSSLQIPSK